MPNDNAGVYFYGTPPSIGEVAALVPSADVSATAEDGLTNIIVKWPDVSVTISINPAWNRDVQLSGIRGWLGQFSSEERESAPVVSFLAELDRTKTCYGTAISPRFDDAGKVVALLKQLLGSDGGFFFSHQSFYDANGEQIAGRAGDPLALGPK